MGLGSQAGRSGFRDPNALGADQREGGTVVQTGGVVQGANTIPRRGRLNALLAGAAGGEAAGWRCGSGRSP